MAGPAETILSLAPERPDASIAALRLTSNPTRTVVAVPDPEEEADDP